MSETKFGIIVDGCFFENFCEFQYQQIYAFWGYLLFASEMRFCVLLYICSVYIVVIWMPETKFGVIGDSCFLKYFHGLWHAQKYALWSSLLSSSEMRFWALLCICSFYVGVFWMSETKFGVIGEGCFLKLYMTSSMHKTWILEQASFLFLYEILGANMHIVFLYMCCSTVWD